MSDEPTTPAAPAPAKAPSSAAPPVTIGLPLNETGAYALLREASAWAARKLVAAEAEARKAAADAQKSGSPALHAKANYLAKVAASLGDAEGGINRALQALEAAATNAAFAKEIES